MSSEPANLDANPSCQCSNSSPTRSQIVSHAGISVSTRRAFRVVKRCPSDNSASPNGSDVTPKNLHFFTEFRGTGPPSVLPQMLSIGDPGDIYIDTENHQLYARYTDGWRLWPGPTLKNTLTHPLFPTRILWWISEGHFFGWVIKDRLSHISIASESCILAMPQFREANLDLAARIWCISTRIRHCSVYHQPSTGSSENLGWKEKAVRL